MVILLGLSIALYAASIVYFLEIFGEFNNSFLGAFCWFGWIIGVPCVAFQLLFWLG